jgi:phosphoglucomutase
MAMLLLLEVLCECKSKDENLYQRLKKLYEKYGWHKEKVVSLTLEGEDGMAKISAIMDKFRSDPPKALGGQRRINYTDYKTGKYIDEKGESDIDFPRENALIFTLEKGWVCVRPSGTEPKIKIYAAVAGSTSEESEKLLPGIVEDLKRLTS